MKVALITTTINIPTVLQQYDKANQHTEHQVAFFVTGDVGTPDDDIKYCMGKLKTKNQFISFKQQQDRWKKLSDLVGPRKIQRRNFSYVAAREWEPDVVITIDDDNYPVCKQTYFNDFLQRLGSNQFPHTVCIKNLNSNKANPFNNGNNEPLIFKRGYSMQQRIKGTDQQTMLLVSDPKFKVGVVQGIALGDPDIDALTRMNTPRNIVKSQSQDVVSQYNWTYPYDWFPYNSQNTAFLSNLLPYQFVLPWVGRYDDIIASYLSQVVMRKLNYVVQFGRPYAIQQRNSHNLMKDLEDQMWGMRWMDYIIDQILQDQVNSGRDANLSYMVCLQRIAKQCKGFDQRNVESARQFLNILGV